MPATGAVRTSRSRRARAARCSASAARRAAISDCDWLEPMRRAATWLSIARNASRCEISLSLTLSRSSRRASSAARLSSTWRCVPAPSAASRRVRRVSASAKAIWPTLSARWRSSEEMVAARLDFCCSSAVVSDEPRLEASPCCRASSPSWRCSSASWLATPSLPPLRPCVIEIVTSGVPRATRWPSETCNWRTSDEAGE